MNLGLSNVTDLPATEGLLKMIAKVSASAGIVNDDR